jgi:hypothetical protein
VQDSSPSLCDVSAAFTSTTHIAGRLADLEGTHDATDSLVVIARVTWVVAVLASAPSSITAQPSSITIDSGLGRVRCYESAVDAGLERRKSIRVCIGATSDTPARCAEDVSDRIGLSDEHAIRLCRTAESMAPATCGRRLAGIGLEDRELVGYCTALAWPLVAARTAGTPACVRAGLERTPLGEVDVVRLCRGSTSLSPVECFERGDETTLLGNKDLVDLCAPVMVSAPTAIRPWSVRR